MLRIGIEGGIFYVLRNFVAGENEQDNAHRYAGISNIKDGEMCVQLTKPREVWNINVDKVYNLTMKESLF